MIYTILGLVVASAIYVWAFSPLETTDRIGVTTAISMVALVIVTSIYAWHTRKMAYAMIEQTKTLRETVSISVRPSVSIEITRVKRGNTYPFEPPVALSLRLQNKGKGVARNLLMICEGQERRVEYSIKEFSFLDVGDKKEFSISRLTDVSTEEIRVAYLNLRAFYNDDLGDAWCVTLEVDKDGKSWKAGETSCDRLSFKNNG